MADIRVDASELLLLAHDLEIGSVEAAVRIREHTQATAKDIRDDGRRFATGMSHLPHLPGTITYETRLVAGGVEAEIGPEKRGQGNLAHLIEFGGPNNGPHPFMAPAFDRHVGAWVDRIADAAGDV